MSAPFVFGTSTVPDGSAGQWTIDQITITPLHAELENAKHTIYGNDFLKVAPGKYKRLVHARRGVIMSNTPMEVATCEDVWRHGTGRVLINGLGLGMVVEALLSKPDVTLVRVIEIDADVIQLVAPHFRHDPRFELIHDSAYTYRPHKNERFDYVWHDIWDTIDDRNLPDMYRLIRKYKKRSTRQGVWSREEARQMRTKPRPILEAFMQAALQLQRSRET